MRLAPASPETSPRPLGEVAPSAGEGATERRTRDLFPLLTGSLVLATVLTRLPFMTNTLYAFDSANYALAVRDFYNVAFHQPHPPGYPLYVFFARGLNLVVQDANRSLILEGIVWSAIAVGCTMLLTRAMFGRLTGMLAGGLLLFTVGFWGYGEVAYPYVALAGETAALALLTHLVLQGRQRAVVPLGLVWAISLGVRWDAAVFCVPLTVWALSRVRWRLRLIAVGVAAVVVLMWVVPMITLTGGLDVYRQVLADYLRVWSPQSAYVVGDFASGGDTQATYNLNFLVNYLRQMLGVGLVLVLYLVGRRFSLSALASDYRARFLGLWTVPPLLVYVFAHLGEPGYVLSLAPQAGILVAVAITDLRLDASAATTVLRSRGWRWLPTPSVIGGGLAAVVSVGIVGWNAQAFARGVGPGRLPDLRAHDATTSAQIDFLKQQSVNSTFVLAHDIFRQLHYYVPDYHVELLFSEYVPDFQTSVSRTELPPGTTQVIVLDDSARIAPEDSALATQVTLREQPHVGVWVVKAEGFTAVEHGYTRVRLMR